VFGDDPDRLFTVGTPLPRVDPRSFTSGLHVNCSGPRQSSDAEIARGRRDGTPKLGDFHSKIYKICLWALASSIEKVHSHHRKFLKLKIFSVRTLRIFIEIFFLPVNFKTFFTHYNGRTGHFSTAQSTAFTTGFLAHIWALLTPTFFSSLCHECFCLSEGHSCTSIPTLR
jgi:hypothetical protein